MTDHPSIIMERAAQRAAADSFFLGHLLNRFTDSGGLSRDALAARLRCSVDRLVRLWMCKAPPETGASFRQDVERIAAFVGCDGVALAQAIREASALSALRSGSGTDPKTVLLAARDRPRLDDPRAGGPHA